MVIDGCAAWRATGRVEKTPPPPGGRAFLSNSCCYQHEITQKGHRIQEQKSSCKVLCLNFLRYEHVLAVVVEVGEMAGGWGDGELVHRGHR